MRVVAAAVRKLLRDHYPAAETLGFQKDVCPRGPSHEGTRECPPLTGRDRADLERLLPMYDLDWVSTGVRHSVKRKGLYVEVSVLRGVDSQGGSVFVFVLGGPRDCAGAEIDVTLTEGSAPAVGQAGRIDRIVVC